MIVIDAGMTELVRPALYGAWHAVRALTSMGRELPDDAPAEGRDATTGPSVAVAADAMGPARVDGPVCESTDTLDRHDLPPLRRGDLVAIGEAGAYAASMAMTYNGRPAAAQVLLEPDGSLRLARRRGTGGVARLRAAASPRATPPRPPAGRPGPGAAT